MTTRIPNVLNDTSAAGYYLRQAEAALGMAPRKQVDTACKVRRITLPGGCVLYVTTVQFWQRQHGGNAA